MQQVLRRTHFWPWSSRGRVVVAPDDEDDLITSATVQLIEQARQGGHTPAYPVGLAYLRRLVRKDLAALPDRFRERPVLARARRTGRWGGWP